MSTNYSTTLRYKFRIRPYANPHNISSHTVRIAIFGNCYQEAHLAELASFFKALQCRNVWVEIDNTFYNYLSRVLPAPPPVNDIIHAGEDFHAAMAISIGGDGTFLHTAQWVGAKEIPILGINTGHLGYMADLRLADAEAWLDRILCGKFSIENRTMIEVRCDNAAFDIWPYALNEVAVLKQDTASMIDVEAYINDEYLANYLADGLVVATPTGSTGYNLSAGGPIVQPTAPIWCISPIAAHSLGMRPLVVGDDSVVTLTTTSRAASFRISLDGRYTSLPVGSTVTLQRAPFVTKMIKRNDHTFAETLRRKLLWGASPRNLTSHES